jgi:hypothetical protein
MTPIRIGIPIARVLGQHEMKTKRDDIEFSLAFDSIDSTSDFERL